MMTALTPLLILTRALGHFISPYLCAACDNRVDDPGLCPSCWQELRLITGRSCQQCGVVFEYKTPLDHYGHCLQNPLAFDDTIAAARYCSCIGKDDPAPWRPSFASSIKISRHKVIKQETSV